MRSTRLGALVLTTLLATAAIAPGHADTGPTRTDVELRGLKDLRDGTGALKVRSRVEGDPALCTGTLRLKVIDLKGGHEVFIDRSKSMREVARFRVSIEDGKHRVVGSYELGDRDPCAESRETERINVRSPQ